MSEDIDVEQFRQFMEEKKPGCDPSDGEVAQAILWYAAGYGDALKSIQPPPTETVTRHRTSKTGKGA